MLWCSQRLFPSLIKMVLKVSSPPRFLNIFHSRLTPSYKARASILSAKGEERAAEWQYALGGPWDNTGQGDQQPCAPCSLPPSSLAVPGAQQQSHKQQHLKHDGTSATTHQKGIWLSQEELSLWRGVETRLPQTNRWEMCPPLPLHNTKDGLNFKSLCLLGL